MSNENIDELKKIHDYMTNMVNKYGYGVSDISDSDRLLIIKNEYIKRLRTFDMKYYISHQEHSFEGPTWFIYRENFDDYVQDILNYDLQENSLSSLYKDDKPYIKNGSKYIMDWKWYNGVTHESHDILWWCKENDIDPLYPSDTERFLIKMHCLSLNG